MSASIFSTDSSYKKHARFIAILWTLLILLGCFMPARNVPKVDVPLMDKWVHFVFFGGFTFLWLCANPSLKATRLAAILFTGIALGCLIEVLQGALPALGRASELLDAVADSVGALLGVILFATAAKITSSKA